MRAFRIKARDKNNKVVNMREYISIQKLRLYGRDLYRRYNQYATAELYEIDSTGTWFQIKDEEEVRRLLNPYQNDQKI